MSKSYHKYPVYKDHNKGQKQIANRHLRRDKNKTIVKRKFKIFYRIDRIEI